MAEFIPYKGGFIAAISPRQMRDIVGSLRKAAVKPWDDGCYHYERDEDGNLRPVPPPVKHAP